jgi:hypothetical protein
MLSEIKKWPVALLGSNSTTLDSQKNSVVLFATLQTSRPSPPKKKLNEKKRKYEKIENPSFV